MTEPVYIVAASRTPTGSFLGTLSKLTSVELGAIAVKGALSQVPSIGKDHFEEIYFGSVIQANLGQSPAKQVALKAGLPNAIVSTTVNKVCASGLKSIILGAQSIITGHSDIVICGGSESMSNAPFYLTNLRAGGANSNPKFGSTNIVDGLQRDGLSDAYKGFAMGIAGEKCAKDYDISRAELDEFSISSYERAISASKSGKFDREIVPVVIPATKKSPQSVVKSDEEFKRYNKAFLKSAKPAFVKGGKITAANSSPMNDGASAVILVSERKLEEFGLKPIAKIVDWSEAEQEPINFTTTPTKAINKLLHRAKLNVSDIDYFEINEAFAAVAVANIKLLGLKDASKVNVYGGAVGLGHALGSSGSRIVVTLSSILRQERGTYGVAAICNGGGGASALLIQNVSEHSKL